MKQKWVELVCDHCGCAEHFAPGNVDADARAVGWIITADGKHYDTKECRADARRQEPAADVRVR